MGDGDDFDPDLNFLRTISPELADIFDIFLPTTSATVPRAVAPSSAAPCATEIEQCAHEANSRDRSIIQDCLLSHYEYVSPTCKCFMHQTIDNAEAAEVLKQREPTAAAPPRVFTVPDAGELEYPRHHEPMRHISCMLFMPLMVLAIALLVRRCCLCCCQQKPVFAAVVPPGQATINSVQPLICVPIAPPLTEEEDIKMPTKA